MHVFRSNPSLSYAFVIDFLLIFISVSAFVRTMHDDGRYLIEIHRIMTFSFVLQSQQLEDTEDTADLTLYGNSGHGEP